MLSKILEITDLNHLSALEDFEFDWKTQTNENTVIYSAQVENMIVGLTEFERIKSEQFNFMYLIEVKPEYRGTTVAGELLAFIGFDSIQCGFDGFVIFESKSVTYKYYIAKYGAKPLRGRRLHFDTEATLNLIETYLKG